MRAGMVGIVLLVVAAVAYVGVARWLQRAHSDQHLVAGYSNALQPNTANTIATSSLGTLEIAVDEGVEIFLNGQYLGAAPVAPLKLKPDLYDLRYEFDQTVLGQEKVRVTPGEAGHNSMRAFLGSLEFFVLPRSETRVQINDKPALPTPAHLTVLPGDYRLRFTAEKYEPRSLVASLAAGQSRNVTVILRPILPPAASESSSTAKGTLAVSSPTAIDNVDVQINANPWADVFLDGVERKRLGQTPLSGVRVPIGSVLVFENPGFPTKKYHVTGNEKRIQIVFP